MGHSGFTNWDEQRKRISVLLCFIRKQKGKRTTEKLQIELKYSYDVKNVDIERPRDSEAESELTDGEAQALGRGSLLNGRWVADTVDL